MAPVGPSWNAEPAHQDYLQRFPNGHTCHSRDLAGPPRRNEVRKAG